MKIDKNKNYTADIGNPEDMPSLPKLYSEGNNEYVRLVVNARHAVYSYFHREKGVTTLKGFKVADRSNKTPMSSIDSVGFDYLTNAMAYISQDLTACKSYMESTDFHIKDVEGIKHLSSEGIPYRDIASTYMTRPNVIEFINRFK